MQRAAEYEPWLYRGVRRHGGWSIVLDGHEVPEVDRVIQRRGTVAIVESTYVGNEAHPSDCRTARGWSRKQKREWLWPSDRTAR